MNIKEPVNPVFEEVYLLDIDDYATGGEHGDLNRPLKHLVSRTAYNKRVIETEIGERIAEDERLQNQIDANLNALHINSIVSNHLKGHGGFLPETAFSNSIPSQDEITNYALSIIGTDDRLKIWDGTQVKNTTDGHVWVLKNAPNAVPPVFEWMDSGPSSYGIATNTGVFGLVTGEEEKEDGSTDGMITIQQSGKMKLIGYEKLQNRIVGEKREFFVDVDEWTLAKNRLLKLNYQLIEIEKYPELCAIKYVCDAKNNDAYWWYKCDHLGNRTVTGQYMRVKDARGIFFRGAGTNAVLKGANNTPYDGKSVSEFMGDAIRELEGTTSSVANTNDTPSGSFRTLVDNVQFGVAHAGLGCCSRLQFKASYTVPIAHENRSASFSILVCVSY
jgi:hypothetical protein